MRLLLLGDDPLPGDGLRDGLAADGHAVDAGCRSNHMLTKARRPFDAPRVDWPPPDGPGPDGPRGRPRRGDRTPAPMRATRDRLTPRVEALGPGADGDLVKPFASEEPPPPTCAGAGTAWRRICRPAPQRGPSSVMPTLAASA